MSYHLKVVVKKKYINIKFYGDWPKETGAQIMQDIFSTVVKHGIKKILLDFTYSNYMEADPLMNYEEATTAATLPNIILLMKKNRMK